MDKVSAGKIGKYEIIRVLGRGGMGEVLLAQDEDLGRRVAIKRPFKSALDDGLARFQVEAKAATLRHPNIPAVYEMGVQDGLPFIAMEYVEGEGLDKIISSGRQLDLIAKLRIIEQVCSALGYAHEKGIIHRDIKPANVIVQPDGVAKIIDFGIAKVQDAEGKAGLTQTSQVIGSLHYIAPERFKGGPIDGRVDIFSAGVTLFKLLTGEEPFTGGEATASYKIVNEAHTPLAAYLHDYPPALDEIIEKSLAKNPEDRYSTGEDFADALHEVIEDLKRTRVSELFNDAERLTTESRFTPALELLEEAVRLDPANTQARKLRKFVREHQERIRRAERVRECIARADEALLSSNFEEALNQLREAQGLDQTSAEIRLQIQTVEERKRRSEISAKALADAEAAKNRDDITAALRIVGKALREDPENQKLLALNGVLARQAEVEAQRGRILELLEIARRELAARNLAAADKLLGEAESMDSANLETDTLRREWARARDQEQRRAILEEIQLRVNEFLRTGDYQQAADLLDRALEKLPNETMLHRLKAEVDSEARKLEAGRFVEASITQARELFAASPLEALGVLQQALDRMPGEKRLLDYERSLRQQLDALRVEQVLAGTLLKARELMAGKNLDKAIGVLESFQVEFGRGAETDDLLAFARDEQARLLHSRTIDRCASESRALIRDGRPEDAVRVLEQGIRETGDASLTRLLEEVREQQAAFARKIEALTQRVELLRGRGELDEAIQLLQEQLAATPGNAPLREFLVALEAEREQRQATAKAIAAAREAVRRKEFSAALESLQAVLRAYGESAEVTSAIEQIESERASYAEEVVGKSIESARAALLKGDPQGALAALKGATQMMEFADARKQADWQRIGQAIKKALEQSGPSAYGPDFEKQLSEIASTRPRRIPAWAIASSCAALLVIGGVAIWRLQPAPPATVAHIRVAKAPPGAAVSIDSQPSVETNAGGEVTVQVKPGSHQLRVSKEGFEPFIDQLEVNAGDTVQDDVSLTRLLPAGSSGTLLPQGNVAEFKLSVDGKNLGLHRVGGPIPLEVGTHKVKYSAQDDSDSQEHTIRIAANQNTPDSFVLKPPAPKPATGGTAQAAGKLIIQTNPGAQISVDGKTLGAADSGGNYSVQGLNTGQHSVEIAQDKFQAANRQVTIASGETQTLAAQLQPVPVAAPAAPSGNLSASSNSIERGQAVTLSWQVSNASSVAISGVGTVAPQGNTTVSPSSTTRYQLTANGSTLLGEQTVDVHEPRQQEQAPPAVTAAPKPAGPDRAELEAALNAYKSLIVRASGKSSKDCKAVLNGPYQGRLQPLARWCDTAKSFDVTEQCNQPVGGAPETPTLTCTESLTIRPKDGDPQQSHGQKTFHFTKGPDGSWQVTGW
jgi:serine/threonine-protein kinase